MSVREMIGGFKAALDLVGPHPSRAILEGQTDGALTMHESVALIVLDEVSSPASAARDEILMSQRFEALVRHTIRPKRREESLLDALDDHRRILRALHRSDALNRIGTLQVAGWTRPVVTRDGDFLERRLRFHVLEEVDLTEQAQ